MIYETSRTNVLAYCIDFDGTAPMDFLRVLVQEQLRPDYLQLYDVGSESFKDTPQSRLYAAATRYYMSTGAMVTPTILPSMLPQFGIAPDQTQNYLRYVEQARLEQPRNVANLRHHIDMLRRYRGQHQWQQLAVQANGIMEQDPRSGIALIQQRLAEIEATYQPAEQVWDFRARAMERFQRHEYFAKLAAAGMAHGIFTGLPPYDEKTKGVLPGELLVIAGRSSAGKSLTLQRMAVQSFFQDGRRTVYASAETGWSPNFNTLLDRFEAMASGNWRSQDLRWGTMPPESIPVMRQWFEYFSTMKGNLLIIPPSQCGTIQQLVTEVRAMHRREPIEMLVVDYINEITTGIKEIYRDKWEVARALMRLGEEIGVPVLTAVQVSRYGKERGDDADAGELMSESEGIAKVADDVIQVVRDKQDNNRLIYKVKKARNGEAGWAFSGNVNWSLPLIGGGWRIEDDSVQTRAVRRVVAGQAAVDDI